MPKGSRLRFECEDLLLTQSLNAATTEPPTRTAKTEDNSACKVGVYVASLLFDPEMMVQLACLLERSSDVRWVATLQRLPLPAARIAGVSIGVVFLLFLAAFEQVDIHGRDDRHEFCN